ncbi:helix-turn-helix domain-containing protein [Piscinibacter sakaiensis]|uniref:helix-turn-helix domain-containing protein n=1 Tax=Piscinibacter sakaiensis TaxID=1547922 RepID=UPI003726DF61
MPAPPRSARPPLSPADWIADALALLADQGIDAVRVDVLARRLGVTRGSFYWHFADRDALLRGLLETWRQQATEQVIARFDGSRAEPQAARADLAAVPRRAGAPGGVHRAGDPRLGAPPSDGAPGGGRGRRAAHRLPRAGLLRARLSDRRGARPRPRAVRLRGRRIGARGAGKRGPAGAAPRPRRGADPAAARAAGRGGPGLPRLAAFGTKGQRDACALGGRLAGTGALPPAAPAVPEPFPLSKEHAQILQAPDERPTLPQLHRQLLDEPRDADWAAATEELLRRDLAAANQAGDFDIPTIQCRQTLCEVLAFGNSPAAIQRWQAAMQERSGAWREAAGLVGNSLSITSAGGRAVIVGILERRPPRRP